jgi:hypothetical protein
MRRKALLILAATVAAFTLAGGTLVLAGSGSKVHPRSSNDVGILISAQSTGGGCRFGYDTQSSTLIPPDDSTADNVPANTVTINKPCRGAVMGLWVGEISTSTAGDFIHMDMRATCTGTGGFSSPCTVGQQVFASPGHTFVQNVQSGVQTHSVQMMWTGLPRGIWRFEVLPGGNNNGNIQFRSFTVQAFNGG